MDAEFFGCTKEKDDTACKRIDWIACILIIFLYIFNFPITFIDSCILSFAILFLRFLFNSKYRNCFKTIVSNKYIVNMFIFIVLIGLFSLIIVLLKNTNDFSFIKLQIHLIFVVFTGIGVFAFILEKNMTDKIFNILLIVFLLQCIIQFVSFVSPQFKELTNTFRYESIVEKGVSSYGGFRGIAISGSGFFGIASAYAILLYFFILKRKILRINKFILFPIIFLLAFGSLSAGRSSIFGAIVAVAIMFVYFIINYSNNITVKFKRNTFFIIILLALTVVVFFVYLKNNTKIYDRYIVSFFESLINPTAYSSTKDVLFNRMYFELTPQQFLTGDGFYSSENSYYLRTDAGFMRDLLFFGLIGEMLLFAYQIYSMKYIFLKDRLFGIGLFVLIVLLHIKGQVVGTLLIVQSIILLINLSYKFNCERIFHGEENNIKCNNECL